jgi:lipid A ethanolaminephosphotransferase
MLLVQDPEPRFSFSITCEQLLWAASLFFAFSANRLFLVGALDSRNPAAAATWGLMGALVVMLVCVHYLVLAPLAHRRFFKPLLALLLVATALATHFMQTYGVVLDPSMVRNALRTDVAETRELLSWMLLVHVAVYALLPLALLWRVQLRAQPWPRALGLRLLGMALALALLVPATLSIYQPLSAMMRNQKSLRYQVTPANLVWSLGSVLTAQARGAAQPRQAIGLGAAAGPRLAARAAGGKPLLLVLVVGETARAANWGLSGYSRQTTPQLAQLEVINVAPVTSCGTNTEVSLPCMFAPVGRRDHDEARIRGSESLLHVLARAGVQVHWRDNQSGCKGVCEGLPFDDVASLNPAGLCSEGRCLDEGLLIGLDARIQALRAKGGTQLLVLHMLGNHGPSYYKRYPQTFKRFVPACEQDDLSRCEREHIVNAYDNALLYTDHVLASLTAKLKAADGVVDSAMVFVSDHGESLGENNLYLHGLPWAIAPQLQKEVPMVMWFSSAAPAALGFDRSCLQQRASQGAAHDHLFHTLLSLLDVKTALQETTWDLTAGCHVDH